MEYLGTVAATKVISSFYSKEKKAVSICNTTTTSTEPKGKGTSEKKTPIQKPNANRKCHTTKQTLRQVGRRKLTSPKYSSP